MPVSDSAADELSRTPLAEWIVSHRIHIFVTVAVFYALAFNGTWRMGRDSALYRGLGHSLATGKGYTFGEFGSRQIYPGLPVLLAGLEKVFGRADWPPIVMIHLFSLGCLILTYKLVRLRFPQWFAIAVVACTAMNGWYLELTNEIRDDIPFLFGMLLALYGWERLRAALAINGRNAHDAHATHAAPAGKPHWVKPLLVLLIGLAIAAVMRPTFWILAIAWVITCVWGLITGPKRRFYATCLGILLVVWITAALIDPRTRGFNPFAGGYERDAANAIQKAKQNVPVNATKMISAEMAYAFFGQKWLPGMTELLNLVAIAAAVLLWRRNPLWTLLVLLTVVVTLLMTAVPRYYVMVLPLMVISWLLLGILLARRVPRRWVEVVLAVALAMVVLPNVARACKVIGEQRGWKSNDRSAARWTDVQEMSESVARLVAPGEKVIGPGAPIMSYLSGREVVMARDILPQNKHETHWPRHLAALNIRYAVFPSRVYGDGERKIRELMDKGVIVPTGRMSKAGELVLAQVEVRVPPVGEDWRKRPINPAPMTAKTTASGHRRPPQATLDRRRRHQAALKREAAEKRLAAIRKQEKQARAERHAAAERAAARQRKARREAREAARRAATQPAATQPVSQPGGPQVLVIPRGAEATRGTSFEWFPPAEVPQVATAPFGMTGFRAAANHFDVGGFSGQSSAVLSFSICSGVNLRAPWLMPWQRTPAASQFSLFASKPSQNGHVRHWSGRTS